MPSSNTAATLPSLPVPTLQDTAMRFKSAVKPLFPTDEYEACVAKLDKFIATEAPILQARLEERASQHENWLEEWWNEYAYFLNRDSLCFNVNYFFGFRNTPQPMTQVQLASALIDSTMRFRQELLSGNLTPDQIRDKQMCMHQYQYMFSTCRHPGESRDWTELYAPEESNHIAIAHKGQFFIIRPSAPTADRRTSIAKLEAQLQHIIRTTAKQDRSKSIGILTASLRDDWYAARECLLSVSEKNPATLRLLESAAFVVSLESSSPSNQHELALACYCADGENRYFDKSFQLLVFENGRYGFNGEHSLTDATTDMRLCNHFVKDIEELSEQINANSILATTASFDKESFTKLQFDYNDELLSHISKAIGYFDRTLGAHEIAVLNFDSFGKEQIKKLKVSPDAFVQMAMQLAYYRQFGQVAPTYESASTKWFSRGRTETSRSVSDASAEWCRAMVDHPKTTTLQEKADLLKKAITNQSQYTAMCAKGYGIDRHLLGLEHALLPGEAVPEIFTDSVFTGSKHWKLSTSQISDGILDAYGWGEVVDDGYGVAYRIDGDDLHFNVTSLGIGSQRLCQYLSDALMDMRFLLSNAHKEPAQIKAEVDAVAKALSSISIAAAAVSPATTPIPIKNSGKITISEVESDDGNEPFQVDGKFRPYYEGYGVANETNRLLPSDVICALETRLSRFVKESLHWALPSTS